MDQMQFAEQRRRASEWWDRTGRKLIVRQFKGNITKQKDRVTHGGRIRIAGDKTPEILSGIALGAAWDQLSGNEQLKVQKAWVDEHHGAREKGLTL